MRKMPDVLTNYSMPGNRLKCYVKNGNYSMYYKKI